MRSSLTVRFTVTLALLAVIGVPGLSALDPTPAQAISSVQGITAGAVWTGVLTSQIDDEKLGGGGTSEPVEPLIVRFRPRTPRATQVSAHQTAGARRADAMALADTVKVTIYLTRREDIAPLRAVRAERLAVAPAVTMVLVAGLHDPRWLVEIEAVAAA